MGLVANVSRPFRKSYPAWIRVIGNHRIVERTSASKNLSAYARIQKSNIPTRHQFSVMAYQGPRSAPEAPAITAPRKTLYQCIDLVVVATGKRQQLRDELLKPRGLAGEANRAPGKGQIDHMLLTGLPSPAPTAILGHVSGENDGFKCGQDFADFHSVGINGTKGLRAPESVLGERVAAQPLNPLNEFLCALLDIGQQFVVVDGAWPFRGLVVGSRARNSLAKPRRRLSVRRGEAREFQ